MAKLVTNTQGGQYAVPPLNTQMRDQLAKQGLDVPQTAMPTAMPTAQAEVPPVDETQQANFEAARANAQTEVPDNMYQAGSYQRPTQQAPNYQEAAYQNQDESTWQDNRQPLNVGQPQLDILGVRGNELSQEQSKAMYNEERRLQKEKAGALKGSWANEQELEQRFPKSITPTTRGTVMDASLNLGTSMANTQVEIGDNSVDAKAPKNTSTMEYLKQTLGGDATKIANLATMALSMTAPIVSGAATTVEGEINDPELASIHAWGSDIPGVDVAPVALTAKGGGIPAETMYGILGNTAMKLHQMGNVDERGNALPAKQTGVRTRDLGAALTQSAIDAGYLISDKTSGEEVFRLHPNKGIKFYLASRAMSREIGDLTRGKSQIVPVTSTSDYVGAAKSFRDGDKTGKVNYQTVPEVKEAMRISGSIGLVVSPIKTYIEALMVNQAVSEMFPAGQGQVSATDTHPRSKVGNPTQGLTSTKKIMGITSADTDPTVLKTKATILVKLVGYHGQNVADNMARYAPHWEDYSVHRQYNDTEDVNAQRDLNSRAVIGQISIPMDVSKTAYHAVGVSRTQAKAHIDAIARQVRNKNFELSSVQREFAWMATLGKVLDVGSKVGRNTDSFLPHELAALVTPDFIQEAAAIGRVMQSIVPASNKLVANAALDMTKLDVNLSPQQLGVLNNFIATSGKKDWGYRLQSYLDAANYLSAKQNGTAFNPRTTLEIDMSSAGRTFLANDIGGLDVLKRVGILYAESTDAITNTIPDGNPRFFFLESSIKEGVDKAFSKDSDDKITAWKAALSKNMNPLFADEFSKSVLLQTDYGMPKSYHFSNARKFLNKNPSFKDEMLKVYNGSEKDLVNDLNVIYGSTLSGIVDSWQQQLPKDMVAMLGMFGSVPSPTGYFGEKLSIGSYMPKETGQFINLTSGDGSTRKIMSMKSTFDAMAPAKPKHVQDAEGNETLFTPGPGSAAKNQVGPIMGQYRESALLINTMNYINGGKKPNQMLFMQPVHDNLILSSDSFLQTHYVANNIILPEIMQWDIQKEFVKDFDKKMADGLAKIKKEDTIYLGKDSDYYGTLVTMDTQFEYIQDSLSKGKYVSEHSKELYQYLISPASGYQPPSANRPDTFQVTPQQLISMIKLYKNAALYDSKGFKLARWADTSAKRENMAEIVRRARLGLINFMI